MRGESRQPQRHGQAVTWLVLLFAIVTGIGTATLAYALGTAQGGAGVPTGGWLTTLFLEPISYQSSGYYYDQNNVLRHTETVFHHGIDVSGGCVAGVYPVYAAAPGHVALAQYINDGYGTQVVIDHFHNVGGNGRYTYSFYAHMGNRTTGQRYINVSPGQYVQAGQLLGYQGNDGSVWGSCSPNPGTHLDWEIRLSNQPLAYNTQMRYGAIAASPNFYTYLQLTQGDPQPVTTVVPGPFNATPTRTPMRTPTRTPTPRPTNTPSINTCGMNFSDLPSTEWSHPYVAYLYCRGIISGYNDGTFRPGNLTTRGQFSKMIAIGFNWVLFNPYFPSFADVPPSHPFYQHIESAHLRGIITGYACGGPGEPCDSQRKPYFRAGADVTRGHAAKMLVLARGWSPLNPASPSFRDVPSSHWAYGYVERAFNMGVITGTSGGFFNPEVTVTRAQLSKMLALTMQR